MKTIVSTALLALFLVPVSGFTSTPNALADTTWQPSANPNLTVTSGPLSAVPLATPLQCKKWRLINKQKYRKYCL